MFEEEFAKLYESEKEEFKRVCNYLLSKTFVLRDLYDKQNKRMITTSEYLFMDKYFDLFENYLSFSGWKLYKDAYNGIYRIENEYGYNKAKFDSFTTYILVALMLTYEEQPPITTYGNSVITTIYDLATKMQILGLIAKRPSKEAFRVAFRRLEQHNLILRLNTSQDIEAWRIMILPTINQVISYDKIKELCENIPEFIRERHESLKNEVSEGENE